MSGKHDIKSEFLGPEASVKKDIKVLNRTITWRESEIEYETDSRHADFAIRELGLESAKAITTPGTSETSAEKHRRFATSWLKRSDLVQGISSKAEPPDNRPSGSTVRDKVCG